MNSDARQRESQQMVVSCMRQPMFASAHSINDTWCQLWTSEYLPGLEETAVVEAAGEDGGLEAAAGEVADVGLAAVVGEGELVVGLALGLDRAAAVVGLLVGEGVGLGLGLEVELATGAAEVLGTTGPAGVVLGVDGMMEGAGVAPGEKVAPGEGGVGTAAATAAVLTTTACDCWFRHSATDG